MANDSEKSQVNWTAIGIGAVVIGVGLIAWKIVDSLTGPTDEEWEEIQKLVVMWQEEFDVLKPFIESIYSPGHTPTDQELATLDSMMEGMRGKEETMYLISEPGFKEVGPIIKQIGQTTWQVALSIVVAGFAIVTLVWLFKNIRRPPSSWNCPRCGRHFGSAEELGEHIMDDHMVALENAGQAQEQVMQTHEWVTSAVAVQSAYYGYTFADWRGYNSNELRTMAAATAIVWAAGIASAADAALLSSALALLLI